MDNTLKALHGLAGVNVSKDGLGKVNIAIVILTLFYDKFMSK